MAAIAVSNAPKQDLEFRNEDGELLKLCLDLTVYWFGSVFDRVEGVLDFYTQAISLLGNEIKYYLTEAMEGGREVDLDALNLLPNWLTQDDRRDLYILSLESGYRKDTLSDSGFYFCADEDPESRSGALRLILPTTYAMQPQSYVELVLSLVGKLDFQSGHGGFSVNWFPTADSAEEALSLFPTIARRYPGIDLADLDITLYAVGTAKTAGIKCINWLTLLGPELATLAGGAEAIQRNLPLECPIFPAGHGGLLIQAGAQPDIGDRNRHADLTAYRAVGRVLAPLRMQHHPDFIGATPASPNEDLTQEWLARFD